MKILNFGSLNIDYVYQVDHIVAKGETLASSSRHIYAGGKGLNQSVAMGRAHAEIYHAGCIGYGGEFLVDLLKTSGVHTDYVKLLLDIPNGHTVIQNEKSGDNCIILYGGANQAITEEQIRKTMSSFEAGDLLVLQNEINALPLLIELAHEKGMKIALNPSPMDQSIRELPLEYIDYFFVNEIEAAQLTASSTSDAEELMNRMQKAYPNAHWILTMGSEGSYYCYKEERLHQDIFKVKAIDTTAAGDTFSGYFLSCLANQMQPTDALRIASCAASITVSRAGAAPSIPTLEEVLYKLQ